MKKKGFTLVEVIAVVSILSIIFLLITPVITGYITQAKKDALKLSATGLLETLRSNQDNLEGQMLEIKNGTILIGNNRVLESNAGSNETGKIYMCESGRTAIVLMDNKKTYCAKKNPKETVVKIHEYNQQVCNIVEPLDC